MKTTNYLFLITAATALLIGCKSNNKDISSTNAIFQYNSKAQTRWSSYENPKAEKGKGALINKGAKGCPDKKVKAGDTVVLMETQGAGIINRMWFTISAWQVEMFRSLVIEMFWDGCTKPAVSVPFGDFFCKGLGEQTISFENEFFADPEGRSFNCFIQMPFKTGAKIILRNESKNDLSNLFYDINFEKLDQLPENSLYFHAYWHRDTATVIEKDFEIMPQISGKGRFLGSNVVLNSKSGYEQLWFGEGEVKAFIDDDTLPTLVGTGTEDYVGSAWGLGEYANRYQGCLVGGKNSKWCFYRFHVPDPIWFHKNIKVTIQQMGGGSTKNVVDAIKKKAIIVPVVFVKKDGSKLLLFETKEKFVFDDKTPEGFVIFYRSDDVASTSYFYYDKPTNDLPMIQDTALRLK